MELLPLNRSWRLRRNIIDHTVHSSDFVANTIRNPTHLHELFLALPKRRLMASVIVKMGSPMEICQMWKAFTSLLPAPEVHFVTNPPPPKSADPPSCFHKATEGIT